MTDLRAVTAGETRASDSPTSPSVGSARRRVALRGRDQEMARLQNFLREAQGGSGRLVSLAGEPGVGKTRLSLAAVDEARALGFAALVGHSYEGEGALPYCPWIEILDRMAQTTPPDVLRTLLGDGAPEVARIFPELRQLFTDLAAPLDLPPEQSRAYFCSGVLREFLERVERAGVHSSSCSRISIGQTTARCSCSSTSYLI